MVTEEITAFQSQTLVANKWQWAEYDYEWEWTVQWVSQCSSGGSHQQAGGFKREWFKERQHWLKYIDDKGMFCTFVLSTTSIPTIVSPGIKLHALDTRLQSIVSHENTVANCNMMKKFWQWLAWPRENVTNLMLKPNSSNSGLSFHLRN